MNSTVSKTGRFKQVILSLTNRGGGMVLQFASLWMVAKLINVEGVGQYAFYTSWMMVLAAIAGFGTPTYTLRTVAVYAQAGDHYSISRYINWISFFLFLTGTFVSVFVFTLSEIAKHWDILKIEWLNQLAWAAVGSLAFMLMRLMTEALKALNLPNLSMALESIYIPALMILICGYALVYSIKITANHLIAAHIIITTTATLFMAMVIKNKTKHQTTTKSTTTKCSSLLTRDILPIWGSSLLGMFFLNLPIIALPFFTNQEEMGQFSIAYRFINICISLLMVVAGIYGPRFAKEYAASDVTSLKNSLQNTQLISLALYAPLFLIFIIFPETAMGLFGAEFTPGAPFLIAMACGQLIYASTGLVGMMMNMIHKANVEFWISLSATALLTLLILTMGHFYSTWGVAVAFGVGLAVKNLASMIAVRYYMKQLIVKMAN